MVAIPYASPRALLTTWTKVQPGDLAALRAALSAQFGPEAATQRARFRDRLHQDPNLEILAVVTHLGPDRAPAFDETLHSSLLSFRSSGQCLTREILVA